MAPNCSIPSCSSKYNKKLSLFGFPIKYPAILRKWEAQIKENFPGVILNEIERAKICHFHFEDRYLLQLGKQRRYLTYDAVPTLFGTPDNKKSTKDILSKKRSFTSKTEKTDMVVHVVNSTFKSLKNIL